MPRTAPRLGRPPRRPPRWPGGWCRGRAARRADLPSATAARTCWWAAPAGSARELSRHLARETGARLAWVGRRPLDDADRRHLAEVERLGGDGDVRPRRRHRPRRALRDAVAERDRARPADTVPCHGASSSGTARWPRCETTTSPTCSAPKVRGAVAFADAVRDEPLDFLAFFSSALSFADAAGPGQLRRRERVRGRLALALRLRSECPVTVVNWGYWGEVGAVAATARQRGSPRLGIEVSAPTRAPSAFLRVLGAGLPQALVVKATRRGLARLGVDDRRRTTSRDAESGFAELERLATRAARPGACPPSARSSRVARVADLRSCRASPPVRDRLVDTVIDALVDGRSHAARRRPPRQAARPRSAVPSRARRAKTLTGRFRARRPRRSCSDRASTALPEVLAGTRRGVDVLFPGGSSELVGRVYRDTPPPTSTTGCSPTASPTPVTWRAGVGRARSVAGDRSRHRREHGFRAGRPGRRPAAASSSLHRRGPAFLRHGQDGFGAAAADRRLRGARHRARPGGPGFHPPHVRRRGRDQRPARDVRRRRAPWPTAGVCSPRRGAARQRGHPPLGLPHAHLRAHPRLVALRDGDRRLAHAPLLGPRAVARRARRGRARPAGGLGIPGTAPRTLEQCVLVRDGRRRAGARCAGPTRRAYVRRLRRGAAVRRDRARGPRDVRRFGVDSLVRLDIIDRFEQDLGGLPVDAAVRAPTIDLAGPETSLLAAHAARHQQPDGRASRPHPTTGSPRRSTAARARQPARPAGAGRTRARPATSRSIGVTGRYPGAPDVDAFWRQLADGESAITEVPADRWDWREHFDPDRADRSAPTAGGAASSTASTTSTPPSSASCRARRPTIDPQERLFLETAWAAARGRRLPRRPHTREPADRRLRRHDVRHATASSAPTLGGAARSAARTSASGRSPTASPTCSTCTARASRSTRPARPR